MTSSTGTVVFNDAKLQAIDVVATERLGVGTLDPASNLHVVGNVHVTGNVNKLNFTDGYTIKRGANVTVFGTTDVIQEITGPHARHVVPLRKYPEVAMTSNIQGGYVVNTGSQYSDFFPGYNAFDEKTRTVGGTIYFSQPGAYLVSDGTPDTANVSTFNGVNGEYIALELPSKIRLNKFTIYGRNDGFPDDVNTPIKGRIFASNDNSSWVQINAFDNLDVDESNSDTVLVNDTSSYKYFTLVVEKIKIGSGGSPKTYLSIAELEYYGYEETSDPDTSVDTKITSQFNLPDTTGVKLYIDGDKGSTATDFSGEGHTLTENNAAYDSAEKAWEFSSLSTSNVTMTSGDLAMEGTHPHSVSLWFNAANVSSNATLFHVGTAAGEGDAKTTISLTESGHLGWIDGGDNQFLSANTWHNLVYATQGGGGVRTCYLDGRKLGDAQVQDTFGDYPPFAMSGYSQGGYTASASLDIGNGEAWEAFDDIEGNYHNAWQGDGTTYSTTTRLHTGGETTTVSGTPYDGDWIQMEFPHKMYLSYIGILPMVTYGVERMPGIAIFAGSNDATTWALIRSITKNDHTAGNYSNYILNSDTCYKYIRIIWNELTTAGSTDSYRNRAAAQEIKFYGHKENDTTRFPVSSTVLKYPHVAMTGQPGTSQNVSDLQHAQRGYEVTASSMYVDNASNPYQPWRAFDGGTNGTWFSRGLTNLYGGTDNTYGSVANANLGTDSGGSATHGGEWLKLKLPRTLVLNRIVMYTSGSEAPEDFTLYGSNDGSSWTEILSETGLAATSGGATYTPSSTPSAYKYFGLVITKTVSRNNYAGIRELELYGTEPEDVVARVGEGLDGKVANFRVYDKYLHEEQALELWDSQKDQFGRAESSVVVHKGRLGVGTTEPEGRFAVLDEAHAPEEFPPRAMTATENYMEGHGVFRVSASSIVTGTNATENVFDKKSLGSNASFWLVGNGAGYNTTDGSYEGESGVIYQLSPETPTGQYITLEMPYRIKLEKYLFMPRYNTNYQTPKDWELWGSNDGNTWTKLHNVVGNTEYLKSVTYDSPQTNFYRYFGFIVTRTIMTGAPSGYDYMAISELKFFGTRERGQSTLHDGQLTLTKNLTVPRIGPALDADDTPRRDRLVVEYNTSTNPTANGTVKDTSGRGLDGLMVGVTYDSTEKAFVSTAQDGSQWIETKIPKNGSRLSDGFSGTIWVNHEYFDTTTKNSFVWTVGDRSGTGNNREFGLSYNAVSETLKSYFATFNGGSGNLNLFHTSQTSFGTWTHAGITYDGTTVKLYINGVFSGSSTLTDVNISDNNCVVRLNGDAVSANSTHQGTPMSLSNFKLYDVALTTDEVKRLYDMGRCDEGHHVVNFSKTRVGIGLGDGEVSDALLNVGGVPYGRGAKPCFCASRRAGNVTSGNTIIFDHVEVNQQNGYNSTTGTFTAPVSGLYLFSFYGMSNDTGNSFGIRAYKNGDTYEMFWPYTHHHAGSPHKHVSGTQIVPMNTGDTFLFKVQAATLYGGSNGHNSFVGYLIE